ncbi:UNVERIFIED_CONTAM: hypothetical protein FKN15_029697 [Acipenser sinensis]
MFFPQSISPRQLRRSGWAFSDPKTKPTAKPSNCRADVSKDKGQPCSIHVSTQGQRLKLSF